MKKLLDRFSTNVTAATGSSTAFIIALTIIIVWGITGPIFNYSDTWQLVINTGTTVITFLMVFLIQQAQNKDTKAIHLKLNELIACNERASNRLVDIEDLSAAEIEVLKKYYIKLSQLSENDIHKSHSIDEAVENYEEKRKNKRIK